MALTVRATLGLFQKKKEEKERISQGRDNRPFQGLVHKTLLQPPPRTASLALKKTDI